MNVSTASAAKRSRLRTSLTVVRLILVESADRVLPPFAPKLSKAAAESLRKLGATLRLGCRVTALKDGEVTLECQGKMETIRARTILWGAGVMGSPLGKMIAIGAGLELDKAGRVPVFLVGFSLGGNVVLKLPGEMGEAALPLIRGVCAVSTPLDLAACARRLAEPDNRFYEARFVARMRARMCATGRYSARDFAGLRSVLQIDDRITAPSFGFGNAAHYYQTQSSIGFLRGLRVPVLLIQAKDDTFVPFRIFASDAVASNPWVELIAPDHGGHLGFLGRKPHRFWADEAIMHWIARKV